MVATTAARYSDNELQEFKILIEEKLVKSQTEVQFLRQQMTEINENSSNQQSGDWTDESSSHMEMEMLINTLGRQQHFMRNLENALLRIQNKTYGVCTLRRLPFSPMTIPFAEGREFFASMLFVACGT